MRSLTLLLLLLPNLAWALCVKFDNTKLRAEAGSKKPVSWVVDRYTPLSEIRRDGGWVYVQDMDGDKHWVYKDAVTNKMVCVSVKVGVAKVRKAPGANAEMAELRQVDRYTAFKRLDAQGEWYEVQASWGDTYWIHESNVWRPARYTKVSF